MAIDADVIDAIITTVAGQPLKAVVDGNSAENHNLKDLLALKAEAAASTQGSGWGRRMARVRLPDAIGPTS